MSATVTNPIDAIAADAATASTGVRRDAFYLQSSGQPLLAWLHTPADQACVDHGVIVCSPIGYEQLHAHRSLRHLADELATQQIPTLRFDWHGTGDSAGIDEDGSRYATWQANLRDAVEWMRQELGCRQVSIVGLRLGATLAVVSTEELEIANLVLWAPVTNGRAYVREMTAIEWTAEFRPPATETPTGDIQAGGFVLNKMAAAELSQLNLQKSHAWCRRALIVGRDDGPADYRLRDRLTSLGFSVDQIQAAGYSEMLAEPHRSRVPERAIHDIVRWVQAQVAADSPVEFRPDWSCCGTTDAAFLHHAESSMDSDPAQIQERAVRISHDPDLFGIITEPATANVDNLPTVIVLNSGSAYHIGPGRLHVHLTRQLAACGLRCLRMDLCGLGDSVTADRSQENMTYPATAFRDVELAIEMLQRDYGVQRCVLMGLCSGAYAAFQSAASITNPAIVESILINPLTFFWKDGMTLDAAPVGELIAQHYYLGSALQPKKWLKLLSGQSKIGLFGAVKLLANRIGVQRTAQSTERQINQVVPVRVASHPVLDDLPGDLASIERAGRTLAMFFATTDPGYSILMHKAKDQTNRLRQAGKLRLTFIKDADHTFSRRSARTALLDAITTHLHERFSSVRPISP